MSHIHLGVYGVAIQENKILLTKKSRGPYIGQWDLPGGAIEFGETCADALHREFDEETGLEITLLRFHSHQEYLTPYITIGGIHKKSHHVGLYYIVDVLPGNLKKGPDGYDSDGAERVSIDTLDLMSLSSICRSVVAGVLEL